MQSFLKHRPILVCVGLLAVAACRKASAPSKAGQPLPGASSAAAAAPANGAPAQAKPVPAVLPAVVARVNGESIERWELENAIRGIEARAGSPMPAERRDEINRGLVDQLIGYHILSQEAHARKLDATDADVDARIAQIKSGLPTPEAFQQALAARGLSLEQMRAETRMSMQASKIIEAEVRGKIS